MSTSAILKSRVVYRESLQEFANHLEDWIPGAERNIARLKRTPADKDLIADLRRALQHIKGEADRCKVELGVLIAHPIEILLGRLHAGEIHFSELLAEVILLALDRLELAVAALVENRPLAQFKLLELISGLDKLSTAPTDLFDEDSLQLIEAVTGFRPAHSVETIRLHSAAITQSSAQVATDLIFFRMLSRQFENRSPLFRGRSQRLLQLALDTNEFAGNLIDPVQLEAAVYFHDLGMMLLPEPIWLKIGQLTEEEKLLMQAHPTMAAGLLERMEGWQDAAQMVAQHHEKPDGWGYPKGLRSEKICAGAKILAIIDAFEAVTLKHRDRGQSRSILRAIAEVNACDKQFAPEWIEHFNKVIRHTLET